MATINLIRRISSPHLFRFTLHSSLASACGLVQHKSTDVDVLDVFTTHILSEKSSRDAKHHQQYETPNVSNEKRTQMLKKVSTETKASADSKALNVADWNQSEIDHYLIVSIECGDRKTFNGIIQQIIELKRLPSDALILRTLCYLCDVSDNSMAIISKLIDLCQETNIAFYAKNVEFAPFLSQYLWKLERFDDALNTLNSIFATTNKTAKRLILRNYRQIIYDAIKNHDEHVVSKIVANAEQIGVKCKDSTLITYVWSDCFFSELFRNQRKADELFTAHDAIRETVSKNIGWIALTLLQQHNVDAIHRLIEICLATELKREVGICLTALFDYHCKLNDIYSLMTK